MTTHFAPFTDLEDIEQAPCGTWLGDPPSCQATGPWSSRLCLKRKSNITKAAAAEERAIVEQMGDIGGLHALEKLRPAREHLYSQAVTPIPSIHCRDMAAKESACLQNSIRWRCKASAATPTSR